MLLEWSQQYPFSILLFRKFRGHDDHFLAFSSAGDADWTVGSGFCRVGEIEQGGAMAAPRLSITLAVVGR